MSNKILFVDDDPNILAGYQRQLRKQYTIETAQGPPAALAALERGERYAVIVSDLSMPGMDGIQLLTRIRELCPDTARILLTGFANMQNAVKAINEGNIFRFLTKPCAADVIAKSLDAGLEQHRLITAEKELLEKTLRSSVHVLGEVLALVNPAAFGRAVRARQLISELVEFLPAAGNWAVDVGAMLSQVGCVTVPEPVLAKAHRGIELTPAERRMLGAHPAVGSDLLKSIPRLEEVAATVAYQDQRFDGEGLTALGKKGTDIPLGARLLKVALDFDALVSADVPKKRAVEQLKARVGSYDPAVLAALEERVGREIPLERREVPVHALLAGMRLAVDLHNTAGALLLSKGAEITESLKRRLANIFENGDLAGRIAVLVPPDLL